jgi:hypothetical protein
MAFGKLNFVREGLIGRLIRQKDWILKMIESIWYKENDAKYFIVSCCGYT